MEDVHRIRRMVHENDKSKRLSHMKNEMGRLMHNDEQELLRHVGRFGIGMTTKAGGLIRGCAPRRGEEVEYIRLHTMYESLQRNVPT